MDHDIASIVTAGTVFEAGAPKFGSNKALSKGL